MERAPALVLEGESNLSVFLKVVKISLPVIGVNLLYTLENSVSLILVSHISPSAIAGVGFASNLLWFIYSLMSLSYTGTNVLVAQRIGAGKDPSSPFLWGLLVSTLIALPLTFFGQGILKTLMEIFSTREEVINYALSYTKPIFHFILVGFVVNTIYGTFNGAGDTKTTFFVGLMMNLTHITSAYLLIPRMGVEGAGYGVVVSELLALILYSYLILVKEKPFKLSFHLKGGDLRQLLKIGFPSFLERSFSTFSFNAFVGLIASLSEKVLAGYQIGLRIESISFMIGIGFMVSATTITGQNFGAGNFKGLKRGVKVCLFTTVFLMGLLSLPLFFLPKSLASIFTGDKEVIHLTSYYLKIVALSQVPLGIAFVLSGALKGLGKTQIPLFVNLTSLWLFRLIPSYLLMKLLLPSPLIPWLFMSLETFLRALLFGLFYRRSLKT